MRHRFYLTKLSHRPSTGSTVTITIIIIITATDSRWENRLEHIWSWPGGSLNGPDEGQFLVGAWNHSFHWLIPTSGFSFSQIHNTPNSANYLELIISGIASHGCTLCYRVWLSHHGWQKWKRAHACLGWDTGYDENPMNRIWRAGCHYSCETYKSKAWSSSKLHFKNLRFTQLKCRSDRARTAHICCWEVWLSGETGCIAAGAMAFALRISWNAVKKEKNHSLFPDWES